MLLSQEETARFNDIVSDLVCDVAGLTEWQDLLRTCLDEQTPIDVGNVLGWRQITSEPEDLETKEPSAGVSEL